MLPAEVLGKCFCGSAISVCGAFANAFVGSGWRNNSAELQNSNHVTGNVMLVFS